MVPFENMSEYILRVLWRKMDLRCSISKQIYPLHLIYSSIIIIYIFIHIILSYIALRESSQLFFETKDSCPVECSDGCCKTIACCETVVDRNSTVSTVKCENSCPVKCSDGCCKTIGACKTVVDMTETRRVSTVKCENSCPVECSDGCCKTIGACETVVDRNSAGSLLSICNVMKC